MHCVDLGESFPTNILLQNLASIQQRTSPLKFDHLAEKSEQGSVSNLSTKAAPPGPGEWEVWDGRRSALSEGERARDESTINPI